MSTELYRIAMVHAGKVPVLVLKDKEGGSVRSVFESKCACVLAHAACIAGWLASWQMAGLTCSGLKCLFSLRYKAQL